MIWQVACQDQRRVAKANRTQLMVYIESETSCTDANLHSYRRIGEGWKWFAKATFKEKCRVPTYQILGVGLLPWPHG